MLEIFNSHILSYLIRNLIFISVHTNYVLYLNIYMRLNNIYYVSVVLMRRRILLFKFRGNE